jgi:hypothetical protein
MHFEHRYLWSTRFVSARLAKGTLSDATLFRYFLAVMAFDWLQFTLIAVTPTAQLSLAGRANAWLTFAVTVLGLVHLYRRNGGAAGRDFLQRYFALSVTVGWKFVVVMLAFGALRDWLLRDAAAPAQAWIAVATMALLNAALFARLGILMRRLA